jgi:hypothetical protein
VDEPRSSTPTPVAALRRRPRSWTSTGLASTSSQADPAKSCGTGSRRIHPEWVDRIGVAAIDAFRWYAIAITIEKIRRLGHGYRNFSNDRRRLLLGCGIERVTGSTRSIAADRAFARRANFPLDKSNVCS